MERIGVREARQNLSQYLDRVKAGESLTITEHGHPVAELIPPRAPEHDPWAALVAAGVLEPPKGPFVPPKLGPPVSGRRLASEVLQEMRDEERY